MARPSLQIKNVASLLLATGASVFWGVAAKRFFDLPPKPAAGFAGVGLVLLLCQLGLIFIESKEEEELSLIRKQRLARGQQSIDEDEKLSLRIQSEMASGTIVEAKKWIALREKRNGK